MKNVKQYTKDCLRTWKTPNISFDILKEIPSEVSNPESLSLRIVLGAVITQAQTYEEICHIIAGLSGELLSELEVAFSTRNATNILEEIGDVQYFILVLAERLSLDLSEVDETSSILFSNPEIGKFCQASAFKSVKYHAGEVIDILKKVYIYRSEKPLEEVLKANIRYLQSSLARLALKNSFTVEEAIEAAIAKLKVRYPDKFSTKDTDNRDLDAESKALSGI